MRKLLTLLFLLPIMVFGQDVSLDHSYTNPAGFKVGDTITIKFNPIINQMSPTLIQFDYQFNNKLLQKIGHTFKVNSNGSNTNAQTSLNSWVGYGFRFSPSFQTKELSKQYDVWNQPNGSAYEVKSDWTVERITIQDGKKIGTASETLLEVKFIIRDKVNTSYTDWSKVTQLNWARFINNSTNTPYVVHGMTLNVNLGSVAGGLLSAVTLKLNTNATNKSDYRYHIYDESQITNGIVNQGAVSRFSGSFDASGEALLSGSLINNKKYYVNISVYGTPNWLDEVVTISDVYLLFQYAATTTIDGTGSGQFQYNIQKILANVNTTNNLVNLDDSYTMLSYLSGNLTSSTVYPITSTLFGAMNLTANATSYSSVTTIDNTFTPSENLNLVTFYHGLNGDVDLSHSAIPATQVTGASGKMVLSSFNTKTLTSMALTTPEVSNLDIVSQLVDGKVVLSINTTKVGMSGIQININYDNNILQFDEVKFDTGNTMTNFANSKSGKLFVGSLDIKGANTIKPGTPYKIIFTPKQAITNTAGLINFGITEGVKTDGTKIKFNIQ